MIDLRKVTNLKHIGGGSIWVDKGSYKTFETFDEAEKYAMTHKSKIVRFFSGSASEMTYLNNLLDERK